MKKERDPKVSVKNKKTPETIKKFLLNTGFPFEMSVAKTLKENAYEVEISPFFLDLEEDKMREIDIIATKKIADIEIILVIECKQSYRDAWIFVVPENNPSRYWKYVDKYRPKIADFKNKEKCFSDSHFFDRKKPLANNYITFDGVKKSDPSLINDAISKAIKSTVAKMADYEYENNAYQKAMFFSVIFFSGDIFLATYNKSLSVKKCNHLLLKNNFSSSAYNDPSGDALPNPIHYFAGTSVESISYEERKKRDHIRKAKSIYTELKPEFILDIVKDEYVKKYLKLVEGIALKVPVEFWLSGSSEEDDELKP